MNQLQFYIKYSIKIYTFHVYPMYYHKINSNLQYKKRVKKYLISFAENLMLHYYTPNEIKNKRGDL